MPPMNLAASNSLPPANVTGRPRMRVRSLIFSAALRSAALASVSLASTISAGRLLHQCMAEVAQQSRLALPIPEQTGVGNGSQVMRLVAAPHNPEVALAVAT